MAGTRGGNSKAGAKQNGVGPASRTGRGKKAKPAPAKVADDDVEEVIEVLDDQPEAAPTGGRQRRQVAASASANSPGSKSPPSPKANKRVRRTKDASLESSTAKKSKDDEEEEYPVEAIRGIRVKGSSYSFLVKWEGYTESKNNWEPEENVRDCKSHILKFLEKTTQHVNTFP